MNKKYIALITLININFFSKKTVRSEKPRCQNQVEAGNRQQKFREEITRTTSQTHLTIA